MFEDDLNTRAAVYDFDGLWFQPDVRWKIVNTHLGVLGSPVRETEGCRIFESILRENPEARIHEYFALDGYQLDRIRPESGVNFTPVDLVLNTADSHFRRQCDIKVLSCMNYSGITDIVDRMFEHQLKYPVISNPFTDAKLLSPVAFGEAVIPSEGGYAKAFERKVDLIKSLLKRHEEDHERPYEQIFLYFTEKRYPEMLEPYLREQMGELLGGRSAVVLSYIAELEE